MGHVSCGLCNDTEMVQGPSEGLLKAEEGGDFAFSNLVAKKKSVEKI